MSQLSAIRLWGQRPEGDMDFKRLFMEHIAPGTGCIIAFLMFLSPLKAVLQIRANKQLGDFNPLPLVAIVANCAGWLVYSCVTSDVYVMAANEPGLLLGVFMAITCYGYADNRVRDLMVKAFLFFTVVISVEGIVIGVFGEQVDVPPEKTAGVVAVCILLCYYAAPLTTMLEVLRSRSSASLYWPTCLMNTVNGLLWVAYGSAILDSFILVPNAIGACLGVVQLVLIQCFPAKRAAGNATAAEAAEEYEPLQGEQRA